MRAAGHGYAPLSPAEENTIHANVLRLIDRVGLQVENEALLERLAAHGGRVERATQRVTYAPAVVEDFIATAERAPGEAAPRVTGTVGIYYGHYLDPRSGGFQPMTAGRLAEYVQVARALPHIDNIGLLGCPLQGVPAALEPLYERYWAWRLGIQPYGSLHRLELCPWILEMCQTHAAKLGQPLPEVFSGGVYLVPPLKLGYQEAEQVLWFLERGLRVHVGAGMPTGGATAPVTLAGMVTLALAEGLLLGLLNRALYGERRWGIWMSVTAMDPRTAMRPYGRPDMALANLMGAQMAQRYGAELGGHAGLTDAMVPSQQAAAQRLLSALPLLLATGRCAIYAGLLAVDEVFSPVQMVLDDELISALRRFGGEYEVSDDAIAAGLVAEVGPGGSFAGEPHTAAWFRRELWEPALWERKGFAAWHASDGRTDEERARERVLEVLAGPAPESALAEEHDAELRRLLAGASVTVV